MIDRHLTTAQRDSFDSLLRAAVDVSVVRSSFAGRLEAGKTLAAGRLVVRRLIGKGGMGAVYEAEDRQVGARVALKVLSRVEPRSLVRFKREFRILADTIHPNLVRLRELFMEEGTWFFTMDLVDGKTLNAHLEAIGPVGSPEREQELRRLLPELVDGVVAIHATGHLHRDLKPSNLLVSSAGRVVIVDFGLLADFPTLGATRSAAAEVVGTVPYMAPEQARGEAATAASDWYAVGTMIYEALTGEMPMLGCTATVLRKKRCGESPDLFPDVERWPAALVALCRELLSPDPATRAGYPEILRLLGRVPTTDSSARAPAASELEAPFVGRDRELAALQEAFELSQQGSLVVCRVSGPPGIGKSALVGKFLSTVTESSGAQAICGRCYERDGSPYKLLDGLVESLAESLRIHAPESVGVLRPLSSLFLRLGADSSWARTTDETPTLAEIRDRAAQAFRSALSVLGNNGPVILHIDDVQWGDVDGAVLLDEILEATELSLVLILTHRDGELPGALNTLWQAKFLTQALVRDLSLGGLAVAELARLVEELACGEARLDANVVARESEGSPYFATEIVRCALGADESGGRLDTAGKALSLEETILSRCRLLPPDALRVLHALSLCDGPTPLSLLAAATEVNDVERAVALLRSGCFVRTHRSDSETSVEPFHDRVREAMCGALGEESRRAVHLQLARAFHLLAPDACEQLLLHFEGAGDCDQAAMFAVQSAARAARAHAYDRAASLYRRALGLRSWSDGERRNLLERLGDALAMCGDAEAASAYGSAAAGAPAADKIRLEMLVAGQLLCSGHISEGTARLLGSIGYLGIQLPRGLAEARVEALRSVTAAIAESAGIKYRDEAATDANQLLRIDACWWAAKGLLTILHPAGMALTSIHLLEALRCGEPMRIARGAYAQTIYLAAPQSEHLTAPIQALMAMGDAAARHNPSANTCFWREHALTWQAGLGFDHPAVVAHADAACEYAGRGGHGLEREMSLLRFIKTVSLVQVYQDPTELRADIWRRDAIRRGDRYLAMWMDVLDSTWWLADAAEVHRQKMLALLVELPSIAGHSQHIVWVANAVLMWIERYLGRYKQAFERSQLLIDRARSHFVWMSPSQRVAYGRPYVRCCVAHAEHGGPPELLERAEAILGEFPAAVSGVVDMTQAGIAFVRGDRAATRRLLERAEAEPGREQTRMVTLAARYFSGLLASGREAEHMSADVLETYGALGIANPRRYIHSLFPGFSALESSDFE